ncbi:MAG: hypothetical protein COA99_17105 [Moraxellaceae bacterium]|nr:MAG: hypothetical protein COA99_17105 [Moraxellaceae bacterium]
MVNLSLGEDYEVILGKLAEKVRERFDRADKSQIDSVIQFARHFYAAAPLEELATKRVDDLYGATVALWDFVQHRTPGKPKVRVFNPKFEDHGWQGTHTIVEILAPDKAFVVESMMMEFTRRDIAIHSVTNAGFSIDRDKAGILAEVKFNDSSKGNVNESLMHIEIDRQSNEETIQSIIDSLFSILDLLELAVGDFQPMLDRIVEISPGLSCPDSVEELTLDEAVSFLKWLVDDHFTFLGFKEYRVVDQGGQNNLIAVEGTALGMCKLDQNIDLMEDDGGPLLLTNRLLVFGKSGTKSPLHRPTYMDFVSIRKFDKRGHVVGEYRLLGLYTSRVFNNSPRNFPIIGRKIADVRKGSGLSKKSHDGKRLFQILETFPREELFQTSTKDLLVTAVGILQIQERRRLRLFVRKGQYGRFISCLIYSPREEFSTALRKKFQKVLCEYVDAQDLEFNTYFTESTLTRLYIVIRVNEGSLIDIDVKEIESRLVDLARSWEDRLQETLVESHGEEKASALHAKYMDAFSLSYCNDFSTRTAVSDIEHMETLSAECELSVSFYRALEEDPHTLRFKIFRRNEDIPLSDVLPMLENLGFRVLGGRPYHIREKQGSMVWIYDFSVRYNGGTIIELDKVKTQFQEAFYQIWAGAAENDSFNQLVLAVGLGWRSVALLRAYARFFKQTGFAFSQRYIKDALTNQPNITRMLVEFFNARFSLDLDEDGTYEASLTGDIVDALDDVASLDEDRILRRYLDMMAGTLRTNFFQPDEEGNNKEYISLKFAPEMIPDLPRPLPMFEIFVYSPRVEGVHLRGGKVARGGLRWSDRMEDFRTEVLGLVKAQQVKNAVIVPVGAKGGFVAKQLPKGVSRDEMMAEVIYCYRTFIKGLLDITDNLLEGEVVPPKNVIRKDGDDTYLVVAADKGTATFSDIANEIANEYGFWLGDAFASGGSVGYDHKKMGITARGAWVSVQRHFREMGLDVQSEPFTVIGIGDMSGDVFGNGLLCSRYAKLVAAFNHLSKGPRGLVW